jgi:beta-glucanase (GH16 family)
METIPFKSLHAWYALIALAAVSGSAHAQTPPAGYSQVWADEFNANTLDRSLWCTRLAFGGGAPLQVPDAQCTGPGAAGGTGDFLKDERERYRDTNSRGEAVHTLSNGVLTLHATKTGQDSYASYESGLIRSKFEFKPSATESYYVAARIRLPNVQGSFAALWLASGFGSDGKLSWPPEIDTLEAALNGKDDTANMVRTGAFVSGTQTSSSAEEITQQGPHFDKRWNNLNWPSTLRGVWLEVGSEWTANGFCVWVNSELVSCENYRWVDAVGAPANPATVILNLAVGGEWAARYGIDDSQPMTMDIDYVRIFKK